MEVHILSRGTSCKLSVGERQRYLLIGEYKGPAGSIKDMEASAKNNAIARGTRYSEEGILSLNSVKSASYNALPRMSVCCNDS